MCAAQPGLYYQHRVTIAKEPVFILDSFLIRFHREIVSGESAEHDQQAGFGQVQVSDERVGNVEIIRG
jgi:hypothetical protein